MSLMMVKREKVSKTIFIIFIVMFLFVLIQIFSPSILPEGTCVNLTGAVGLIDNQEKIEIIPFPLKLPYSFGDLLCHQKSERSFFLNGNQLPFCSRCTAIWIGLLIGVSLILFYQIDLNERFMLLIILSLVPIGVDGTGQLFGFWESSNLSRVITGLIVGIPIGCAIGMISDELKILFLTKTN
jgi:uncharacterized membrane protein